MLRIIFGDQDLARVRVAPAANPLWEIANGLHRLQTRVGRTAFTSWHDSTRERLVRADLVRTVQHLLIPLLPWARYFPDFLTPAEGLDGLDAGLDAVLRTPRTQVDAEIRKLARLHRAPGWGRRVADGDLRVEIADALRTFHETVIAPHENPIGAAVAGDRVLRITAQSEGGVDGLLASFGPAIRWRRPVLEVAYPVSRDVHLDGRGLQLVPSYFCWRYPVTLVDPELPPVLVYPLVRPEPRRRSSDAAAALLGGTRASILTAAGGGLTAGDIARAADVTPATASHHLGVLHASGLVTRHRRANTVRYVRTPLGDALLEGNERDGGGDGDGDG